MATDPLRDPDVRAAVADEDRDTHAIVERFQRGERQAFASLYARYFERVHGYLTSVVGASDAEHATQEVFRLAFEGLGAFEPRGPAGFRRWLFKIARNHALDQLRELGRVAPEDPTIVWLLADRPDPAQQHELLRGHDDFEFERLVRPLPKRQRQVLWLRYVRDLDYAEIAERLGVDERAVKQAAFKGRASIRARVEARAGHESRAARHPFTRLVRLPARLGWRPR